MNPPPSRPASGPSPYIAINGTEPHEPVTPRRHSRQVPQLIWNGTTTRSPTRTSETSSPTATTSAKPSCPTAYPGGSGAEPRADRDVEVAAGHHQRFDQRLFRCRDRRVGGLAPCVSV